MVRENNQAGGFTHTWTYDNAGNIQERKEYAYTTGALGTVLDTINYTYEDTNGWGDLLTAYDGQTITYDTIGNPLTDGTWTYTWDHGRRLESMSDGTDTWQFSYNADGLRTKRESDSHTYTYRYDGDQLRIMSVDNVHMSFVYNADGPMAISYSGTTYYYTKNLQGDITGLVDANGNSVVEYTYDAWGNILSITGSLASTLGAHNPLRYRGYVYDQDSGLYYLQSRYYDPEVGRFINADGVLGVNNDLMAHNVFAYCSNTPIMLYDPSGAAAQVPWQMLGFTYDGSAGDFRRLENGLPPLAYENWLARGGTVKPNYARTVEGTTVSLDAATYIPNHMIYEYYMNETTGAPTSILFGATSLGIDILLEITGKSIPALNVCMYIVEGILIIEDLADWRDREVMENAISQGTGVLILVISVKGARSGNSTQTVIRTWDGKGDIYV